MVMPRPIGKAQKIAAAILKNKGVKVPKTKKPEKMTELGPYLQH